MPKGAAHALRTAVDRFGIYGGMHSKNDSDLPEGIHAPATDDAEIGFTLREDSADLAFVKAHLIAKDICDGYVIYLWQGYDDAPAGLSSVKQAMASEK